MSDDAVTKPEPKSASDRKRDFDRLMRNKGRREDPTQPERTPCQLYLSSQARELIAQQRKGNRAVGTGPQTDSAVVEAAVIAGCGNSGLTTAGANDGDRLRRAVNDLTKRLDRCRQALRERGDVHARVVTAHREQFWFGFAFLHAQLLAIVRNGFEEAEERRRLHREIEDYLSSLVDDASGDGR